MKCCSGSSMHKGIWQGYFDYSLFRYFSTSACIF